MGPPEAPIRLAAGAQVRSVPALFAVPLELGDRVENRRVSSSRAAFSRADITPAARRRKRSWNVHPGSARSRSACRWRNARRSPSNGAVTRYRNTTRSFGSMPIGRPSGNIRTRPDEGLPTVVCGSRSGGSDGAIKPQECDLFLRGGEPDDLGVADDAIEEPHSVNSLPRWRRDDDSGSGAGRWRDRALDDGRGSAARLCRQSLAVA
jgi:hypothetical protein